MHDTAAILTEQFLPDIFSVIFVESINNFCHLPSDPELLLFSAGMLFAINMKPCTHSAAVVNCSYLLHFACVNAAIFQCETEYGYVVHV